MCFLHACSAGLLEMIGNDNHRHEATCHYRLSVILCHDHRNSGHRQPLKLGIPNWVAIKTRYMYARRDMIYHDYTFHFWRPPVLAQNAKGSRCTYQIDGWNTLPRSSHSTHVLKRIAFPLIAVIQCDSDTDAWARKQHCIQDARLGLESNDHYQLRPHEGGGMQFCFPQYR